MSKLIAHSGAIMVPEERVLEIPAPTPTETYTPISHREMIQYMGDACNQAGLNVSKKQYALSQRRPKDSDQVIIGDRMFGVWELDKEDNGHHWAIGLRNSLDKSMSVGITAGVRVFVCDNLAFSGEYIATRKHTSGLNEDELRFMTRGAVVKIMKKLDEFSRWHRALKHIPTTIEGAMTIFVQGLERNIFPANRFKSLLDCWKQERLVDTHENREPSMATVYGSFTRLFREDNLFKVAEKTSAAADLLEQAYTFRTGGGE